MIDPQRLVAAAVAVILAVVGLLTLWDFADVSWVFYTAVVLEWIFANFEYVEVRVLRKWARAFDLVRAKFLQEWHWLDDKVDAHLRRLKAKLLPTGLVSLVLIGYIRYCENDNLHKLAEKRVAMMRQPPYLCGGNTDWDRATWGEQFNYILAPRSLTESCVEWEENRSMRTLPDFFTLAFRMAFDCSIGIAIKTVQTILYPLPALLQIPILIFICIAVGFLALTYWFSPQAMLSTAVTYAPQRLRSRFHASSRKRIQIEEMYPNDNTC